MKTRNWQSALTATLLGLVLVSTRAADAVDPTPVDGPSPEPAKPSPAVPSAVVAPSNPAPAVPAATEGATANTFQIPKLGLPPLLDQVVRLNQSGTDEGVVRAYIEKAAPPYQITGNEILQLQERGVPKSVILSLIEHSKTVTSGTTVNPPATATAPAPAAPQISQTNDAEAGTAEAAADFREPLAPYGTWLDVPGYGNCWQPTVVVVNPSWSPYCDNGDWRWSDSGWYWHSYYSWGWAPFHYGRWFADSGRGWLWCPDRVWGPAWVSWRSSAAYCGWAPLPPGACFIAGRGWTFRGASVGLDFSFGLGAAHFTFVAHNRFSERHVGTHALRGSEISAHYRNTSVVNGYAVGQNNRVINHGVGRERIAAASQTPIREVAGGEPSRVGHHIAAPQRVNLVSSGNRVGQPVSMAPTAGLRSAPSDAGRGNMARALPQAAPNFNRPATSRSIVAGGGTQQRATPNFSQNYAGRIQTVQPNRSFNAMPAQRSAPVSQYQPRAYAPARSVAPAGGHPQRFGGSSSMGRSMPSGGGSQFRGAVARGGGNASTRSFAARR